MKKIISVFLVILLALSIVPMGCLNAFASTDCDTAATGETTVAIESDSGLGGLISNSLEATEEEEKDIQNCVLEVTVAENIATVKFNNAVDCKIIVAIYDEQTQLMVGSGMAEFEANTESADITLDIDTMPEFFVVRAYLLDTDNKPLHKSYESIEYTKAHQEFLATTVNDFEEETVLNFDESEDNNFAVFADNTVVIYETDTVNNVASVDDETKTYIFENADDMLLNIATGIPFYYEALDGTAIAGVVAGVTVDGTTVTIVGDADAALDDVFEFVKIDTTADGSDAEVDTSVADEGVEYIGVEEEPSTYGLFGDHQTTGKGSHKWSLIRKLYSKGENSNTTTTVNLNASIGISVLVDFKCSIYWNYFSVELSIKEKTTFDVSLSGKIESKQFKLGTVPISVGLGALKISVDFYFVIEVSGEVKFEATETSTTGFRFDSRKGKPENISIPSKSDTDLMFKGKLYVGIKAAPTAKVFDGAIKIELPIKAGLQIDVKTVNIEDTEEIRHKCNTCIAGDIKAIFSVSASYKFKIKIGKISLPEYKDEVILCELTIKLRDIYRSNGEWGVGTCPNNLYKTTFLVVDKNGKAIANTKVGTLKTDKNGTVKTYLAEGEYGYTVSKSGYIERKYAFKVKGVSTQKIVLYKSRSNQISNSIVKEENDGVYDTGTCGTNASYTLYNNGLLVIEGKGEIFEESFEQGMFGDHFRKIKNVKIQKGITAIGHWAFLDCYNMESVTIPNTVTMIAEDAFSGCDSLKSITIPESVTQIGGNSFGYYPSNAFGDCDNLTNIIVSKNNKNYCDIDGVVFTKDKKTIVAYPSGRSGSYTIPEGVTSIGSGAFEGCRKLTQTVIPNSVTSIKSRAFYLCTSLDSIIIPNSITKIENEAFSNCYSITSITVPNGITSLEAMVFWACHKLENITIFDSVTTIGYRAFGRCENLKNVYYGGSKDDWNNIYIGVENTYLTNANIHYNNTMTAENDAVAMISTFGLQRAETSVAMLDETESVTTSYIIEDDLVPNAQYVLMIVLDDVNSCEITTDTLLYITDATADVDGCAEFEYFVDTNEPYVVMLFGACNHSSTEWVNASDATRDMNGLYVHKCMKCDEVLETEEYSYVTIDYLGIKVIDNGKEVEAVIDSKYAEQFADLCVTFMQNGQETIVTDYTVNGNSRVFGYAANTDDIARVQLKALTELGNTVTANAVECNLASFNGEEGTKYVQYTELDQGDANGDGVTDVKDIVRTKKILAELADKTDNADISGDGSVATGDLVLLAKYIVSGKKGMIAHTVTFADSDGSTLLTMLVPDGFGAKPDIVPQKDGYAFAGWDKEYCNVTSDIVVTATYNENTNGNNEG